MNIARIESEALAPRVEDRALLAHRLLLSLEEIVEPEFDRLWDKESARRATDEDAGQTRVIFAEEIARNARALVQ